MTHPILKTLLAGLAFAAAVFLPTTALSQDILFYDFACKGIERHKGALTRTTTSSTGPVTHEYQCIDRSCFHWSVMNPGAENEMQLVEHILIDDETDSFTFSMMTWKAGDEAPSYRYSRVKQLLECVSPVHE